MTQRWLLRVASHSRHGGGHVARSGTLAQALAAAGAWPLMWLDPDSPDAAARLAGLGLDCTAEPGLPRGPWSGSVLDGYSLNQAAAELARGAPPLVVLDDLLAPPSGAALVVNGAVHLSGEAVAGIPALLGPAYALVNPGIATLPERDRARPVREILVTFGRLDPDNAAGRALDALERTGSGASITVVASAASPHRAAIEAAVQTLGRQGRLVLDAPDMRPYLAAADLAVGAGGVSLMERMAAGVPSVTLVIAENQRLFLEGAARLGGTLAGPAGGDSLVQTLRAILADGGARAAMAAAGRRIVDGKGAARVARRLMEVAGS